MKLWTKLFTNKSVILEIAVHKYDLPDAAVLNSEKDYDFTVWKPDGVYIVLGRANNASDSIYSQQVKADNIPVYKRPSGGESVVLSPRMAVFSLKMKFTKEMNTRSTFANINRSLISNLKSLNIDNLGQNGISDLSIGVKKIAGSSMYLLKDSLFYHAVLNINEDVSLFSRYLKHPKREPDYRQGRSHEEFVTSLWNEGYRLSFEDVSSKITLALEQFLVA